MLNWKRIFPYLILNIIVSAVTTLGVLWAWENFRQANNRPASENASAASTAGPSGLVQTTLAPIDQPLVRIEGVYGVNDLQTEYVRLVREGEGDLSLQGWQLKDENDQAFSFPEINFINGAIEIYTQSGPDSVLELHWGLDKAVWRKGETVTVLDPQGNLRASYTIP